MSSQEPEKTTEEERILAYANTAAEAVKGMEGFDNWTAIDGLLLAAQMVGGPMEAARKIGQFSRSLSEKLAMSREKRGVIDKPSIDRALRNIGLALHASNGLLATDRPDLRPNTYAWTIDHSAELEELEYLESLLSDTGERSVSNQEKKTAEERFIDGFDGENLQELAKKCGMEPETAYAIARKEMIQMFGSEEKWAEQVEKVHIFTGGSFRVAELFSLNAYEEAFRTLCLEIQMTPNAWLAALGAASRSVEDEANR